MAKILLVDDHPDMREVVGQMLQLHGHAVELADSGEQAWKLIEESLFDAIVVDQRLPGISGMDLLKRVRQSAALVKVPVILCSGDDSERDAAFLAGACDFWLKGSEAMFDSIARLGERIRAEGVKT